MSEEDLIHSQRCDLTFVQNLHFGLRKHSQDHAVEQSDTLGLGQPSKSEMDLGQTGKDGIEHGVESDRDFLLAQTHDNEMTLSHAGNEDYKKQNAYQEGDEQDEKYSRGNENESNLGENSSIDVDRGDVGMDNHNRQLVLTGGQSHELGMLENHDLAIVENQDIDKNLELVVNQNHEMGIVAVPDFCVQQAQLVFTFPIVQSRTLIPASMYELFVWQEFPDVKSCRRALRDMAIALHFEIQTLKSDKTRFTAKCASEAGCPWRVHAAKLPGVPTFSIRTIHAEHTCSGIPHLGHQQASVEWVANSLEQRLLENPNYKPKEILEDIHRVHGIALSYKQAWRAKERIMTTFHGSLEEDYRLLPQYYEQICRTNPASIASVYINPADNCFQQPFISFQASIYGFINSCRPLIGLYSTILKSKYLRILLFATAFDGNSDLFPLAFGVVDEESDDNWMWFLAEMRNLLEINTKNMPRLTILSDRQKGITDAVEANFPTAFHGFCLHYLAESFRKEFNNDTLVNLLWKAANALTLSDYEAKIKEIGELSADAAYWIRRVPPHLWANTFFEGTRFGQLTANIVESLNAWILEASSLPIVQMMECIRRQLMTWFNERRETSMQWTSLLVPSAERRVAESIERARTYQVLRANEAEFEVISHEGTNIVHIRNRSCSCQGWQIYGLPCSHAMAALLSCRQNVHRFTESYFTVSTYQKAYSQTIHPVPDQTFSNEMSEGSQGEDNGTYIMVNPPKSLRSSGQTRRKRTRVDDGSRAKRVVHCSRCNQAGHFRTTCVAPI